MGTAIKPLASAKWNHPHRGQIGRAGGTHRAVLTGRWKAPNRKRNSTRTLGEGQRAGDY